MTAQPRRIGRPPALMNGQTVPERLLEAARDLFSRNGFAGTSVQEIVTAAGVTKGAMYHYFSSKDDLLAEIYARVLRMQTARLEAYAYADAPVLDRLAGAADDVVVTTIENLPSATIFFRSMHQLGAAHELEVRRQRREYHDMFRQMVRDGQESGQIRADVDADLVVDYFFGAVHHLPMWWRPDRGLEPAVVGREYARLLIDGLRSR